MKKCSLLQVRLFTLVSVALIAVGLFAPHIVNAFTPHWLAAWHMDATMPFFLLGMAFDNTVSADLQLAKILDLVLEAFVSELLPVKAFSLGVTDGQTLNAVGRKKLEVKYLPVIAAASRDFNASAGDCYETDTTDTQSREININKRKYQSWGITSEQYATEPALQGVDFIKYKGRKLAADVLADILSVVDDTNFPNESVVGAANAFDTDTMFDVREDANTFKMPKLGRSVILDDAYYTNLAKDNKAAQEYGGTDPRWNAQVPRIAGMDVYSTVEGLDGTANVDGGIVAFQSGILVAQAPLEPHPKIRPFLVDYQVVTHAESGLSLVYKAIADPKCDNLLELVECTYGYAPGEAAALMRLVAA